ncbi:MAG: hypothetical protein WC742_09775 [Gallionellaceae bacterium]|jgi:hypothetical protein
MSESELQHTQFDSVGEYIAKLDELSNLARHSLYIFENNFEDLGFNSEARYEALRYFLLNNINARLHLLAHDSQPLVRFCPRMIMLLRQFSHKMHIHQTSASLRHITEPFAVADQVHFVRRFHFDDIRGIYAKNDPEGAILLHARFEEMWESSHPGASATTLGL